MTFNIRAGYSYGPTGITPISNDLELRAFFVQSLQQVIDLGNIRLTSVWSKTNICQVWEQSTNPICSYSTICEPQIEGILPKGSYLPCVSMAGRALSAGYHRNTVEWCYTTLKYYVTLHNDMDLSLSMLWNLFTVTSHRHLAWQFIDNPTIFQKLTQEASNLDIADY